MTGIARVITSMRPWMAAHFSIYAAPWIRPKTKSNGKPAVRGVSINRNRLVVAFDHAQLAVFVVAVGSRGIGSQGGAGQLTGLVIPIRLRHGLGAAGGPDQRGDAQQLVIAQIQHLAIRLLHAVQGNVRVVVIQRGLLRAVFPRGLHLARLPQRIPLHQQGGRRAPVLGDGLPGAQQGVVGEGDGLLFQMEIRYKNSKNRFEKIGLNIYHFLFRIIINIENITFDCSFSIFF